MNTEKNEEEVPSLSICVLCGKEYEEQKEDEISHNGFCGDICGPLVSMKVEKIDICQVVRSLSSPEVL